MNVKIKMKALPSRGKSPLSKLIGSTLTPKREHMKKAAKIILDCVRAEIRVDVAKVNGKHVSGEPLPIPNSSDFEKSFYAKVFDAQIEIGTDWPFAEEHTEKKQPPKAGQHVPLITRQGFTVARVAPLIRDKAWIHPGFLKYTFLERGIQKGMVLVAEMLAQDFVIPLIAERDIFL